MKKINAQQNEMYDEKKNTVRDRIVSLHKDYIRPIVRGKNGKQVEFGVKVHLSHANGFMFANHLSFDNFKENQWLQHSIDTFEKRFGSLPDIWRWTTFLVHARIELISKNGGFGQP